MSTDTTFVDIVDALDTMMSPGLARLPVRKVKWNAMKGWASSGHAIVEWLLSNGFVPSRSGAAELAKQIIRAGGLIPTFKIETASEVFNGSSTSMYVHRGLTCLSERGLNFTAAYPGKSRATMDILLDISLAFAKVVHIAVSVDGHWVDYNVIRGSCGWREMLVLLSELAISDDSGVAEVDDSVKKCCLFNLYNVLIFHAKLVFDHPRDLVKRGKFFNEAAYVIAGKLLTSVELEHDVLRRRMHDKDSRAGWRLAARDPRMHFILNCGAQSCPPIVPLALEHAEEMMQDATERFIERNCFVDLAEKKVTLSRLWKWFRYDFTSGSDSDGDLLEWISKRASKQKSAEISELMKTDYKVKFAVYNWADNGNDTAKPDIRFMSIYDISFAKTA